MDDSSKQLFDAVLANPADIDTRSVYSDHLCKLGDPAGNYLRLEIELSELNRASAEAKSKRSELTKASGLVNAKWLRRFQQPDLMLVNPTRFASAWLSSGLCRDLKIERTYGRYEYSRIATVANEDFAGTFHWLEGVPETQRPDGAASFTANMFEQLDARARAKKVALPSDFCHFLQHDPNVTKIPSITGCYFNFESDLFRAPGDEGWLAVFYHDSQGCCYWYLYLDDFGGASICWAFCQEDSAEIIEFPEEGREFWLDVSDDYELKPQHPEDVYYCAPDFETFVYRLRCENTIWMNQYWREGARFEKPELDSTMEAYLAHYRAKQVVEIPWPQ